MILASSSPRRHVLLGLICNQFSVQVPDVDETLQDTEGLKRVAEQKRDAVAGDIVLAADTIGLLDGEILLKPTSEDDARRILTAMNGSEHEVWTAVAVTGQPTQAICTKVRMQIPSDVLEAYLASGLWEGKAGAYGIQDEMIAPYITIDGPWSNVVGLPLAATHEMLTAAGVNLLPCPEESQLLHQNPFHGTPDSSP